jgi:RES domain-containing protein
VRPEHAPGLDGIGARRAGGRWNSPGTGLIYAAGSLALASLEYFVHVPPPMRTAGKLPALTAVQIELPPEAGVEDLSDDFAGLDDMALTRRHGDNWVRERRSLALRVPSLVVRQEWNLLVNPEHPEMARVRVLRQEPFVFDPRLAP